MTQKRKERHKETPTYQTPGNDPRASLKWPSLSAPFRGLPTAGQGGSASWSLYPGQLAKTGPGPAPRCGWSSLAAPAETACPGGGGQWGWSQACLSKLSDSGRHPGRARNQRGLTTCTAHPASTSCSSAYLLSLVHKPRSAQTSCVLMLSLAGGGRRHHPDTETPCPPLLAWHCEEQGNLPRGASVRACRHQMAWMPPSAITGPQA